MVKELWVFCISLVFGGRVTNSFLHESLDRLKQSIANIVRSTSVGVGIRLAKTSGFGVFGVSKVSQAYSIILDSPCSKCICRLGQLSFLSIILSR